MKVHIIYKKEELKKALSLSKEAGIFSFDIETTSRERYLEDKNAALNPRKSYISTISFAFDENNGYVVPLNHVVGKNIDCGSKEALDLISEVLKDNSVLKVIANINFELKFLTKLGYVVSNYIADPLHMALRYLEVTGQRKVDSAYALKGLGLKAQSEEYLGYKMDTFEETVGDSKGFAYIDIEQGAKYSGEDSIVSLRLYNYWKQLLEDIPIPDTINGEYYGKRPYKNYYEFLIGCEMPVFRAIGFMMYHGIRYNAEAAKMKEIEALRDAEAAKEIIRAIGLKYNKVIDTGKTGKTKAVRELLFKTLKSLVGGVSDKTGEPSLDSSSIADIKYILENNLRTQKDIFLSDEYKKLYKEHGNVHPNKDELLQLLDAISIVQKNGTMISSHIEGRLKYLENDGRICSSYGVYTETSRFNSSSPNAQNIPAARNDELKVRSLYEPEKGHFLLLIDYSAQEVRISAELYKDKLMQDIIKHGWDIHSFTAKTMFNLSEDFTDGHQAEKKYRTPAKPAMFTVTYGGGASALQATYKDMGIYKSIKDCQKVVDAVKETYPGIKDFSEKVIKFAEEKGYVETMLGYRRNIPAINSSAPNYRFGAQRQACNTPVQGTAADVTKMAMNRIYDCYVTGELNVEEVKLIATIHDELVFEVKALAIDKIDSIVSTLCSKMEEPIIEGQVVLHKAEPEIADPHDVYSIGESNGWADKYSYRKWRDRICNIIS